MEYHELHQLLDIEAVKGILSSLGTHIDRYGKFALRNERTPSCGLYVSSGKVRIKDFGTGFNEDIFDCLQNHFFDTLEREEAQKEAFKYVMNYLGLKEDNQDYTKYKKEFKSPIKDNSDIKLSSDEISKINCPPLSRPVK